MNPNEPTVDDHKWRKVGDQYMICHDRCDSPVVGLRLETELVHSGRYEWDRKNYVVGMWCSWIKTASGAKLLTWPEGTSFTEMKKQIEHEDVRICGCQSKQSGDSVAAIK